MRVVRNQESEGEEYENPHLVRRYTKEYWQAQQLQKSQSLEMSPDPENLPYTVSGHTILKKHSSGGDSDSSPPCTKHACFKEDIEVFEFDKKSKIKKKMFFRHQERLIDSSEEDGDSDTEFTKLREQLKGKKAPVVEYSSEEEETVSVTDSMGEMCFSDMQKETMTLTLLPEFVVNGLCSPVNEEDEESLTDSGSEMSDIVFEMEKGKKRLCSSDSDTVEMDRTAEEKSCVQSVVAERKHDVES